MGKLSNMHYLFEKCIQIFHCKCKSNELFTSYLGKVIWLLNSCYLLCVTLNTDNHTCSEVSCQSVNMLPTKWLKYHYIPHQHCTLSPHTALYSVTQNSTHPTVCALTRWPEKIGVIYSVAEMMQFCEPKPGKELAFVFIMFKLNDYISMLLKTTFNSNIQGHLFFLI